MRRTWVLQCSWAVFAASFVPAVASAANLHVDARNAGAERGDESAPFRTVAAAIAKATAGDTVRVAEGSYTGALTLDGKGVILEGGYVGGSAANYAGGKPGDFAMRDPKAHVTELRGTKAAGVVFLHNAEGARIDGFRITGGSHAVHVDDDEPGTSVTIANDVMEGNGVDDEHESGGGVLIVNAKAVVENNVIRNNISGRGAGIAGKGPSIMVRGNLVESNVSVSDHGGGIWLAFDKTEITKNVVRKNEVGRRLGYGYGGGILVHETTTVATLSFNVVTENYANGAGSGIFVDDGATAFISNELVYANACGSAGGSGIYVDGFGPGVGSKATLRNVTVANHPCKDQTAGGNALFVERESVVDVSDSIFWGNGGDDVYVATDSRLSVRYSDAEEAIDGTGNLRTDPGFVNPTNDFHLKSTFGHFDVTTSSYSGPDDALSPCIDTGDPISVYLREPQPNGGRVDMGAYGNAPEASLASIRGALGPGDAIPPSGPGSGVDPNAKPSGDGGADAATNGDGGGGGCATTPRGAPKGPAALPSMGAMWGFATFAAFAARRRMRRFPKTARLSREPRFG
ncbi:MAG: right-handed parallel beta-helix repeat-containing protein [Polyangiaceae bacterium]